MGPLMANIEVNNSPLLLVELAWLWTGHASNVRSVIDVFPVTRCLGKMDALWKADALVCPEPSLQVDTMPLLFVELA